MAPDADPPVELYPNGGQTVLLVFIALGLQVATGSTAFAINYLALGDVDAALARLWDPWTLLPVLVISGSLTLALGLRGTHEPARQFLRIRPFPINLLIPVALTAVGLAIVLSEVDNCIINLILLASGKDKPPADLLDMSVSPLGAALLAVLAAPLLEEYLFRGMILRGLLTHYRPLVAIVSASLAFGIVHGNIRQFILAVVIGAAFGWWFTRTRSVGPGMIGHALFNAVAWGASQFPDVAHPLGLHTAQSRGEHSPWWFTLGGLALTGLGIWIFHRKAPDLGPEPGPPVIPWTDAEPPLLAEIPPLAEPPSLNELNEPIVLTEPPELTEPPPLDPQ